MLSYIGSCSFPRVSCTASAARSETPTATEIRYSSIKYQVSRQDTKIKIKIRSIEYQNINRHFFRRGATSTKSNIRCRLKLTCVLYLSRIFFSTQNAERSTNAEDVLRHSRGRGLSARAPSPDIPYSLQKVVILLLSLKLIQFVAVRTHWRA